MRQKGQSGASVGEGEFEAEFGEEALDGGGTVEGGAVGLRSAAAGVEQDAAGFVGVVRGFAGVEGGGQSGQAGEIDIDRQGGGRGGGG